MWEMLRSLMEDSERLLSKRIEAIDLVPSGNVEPLIEKVGDAAVAPSSAAAHGWPLLSEELQRIIVCALWNSACCPDFQEGDKRSALHALMLQSKTLRLIVSSFITALEARGDMLALRRFPRHALPFRVIVDMHPVEAVHWLLSTSAAANHRLSKVSHADILFKRWPRMNLIGNLRVTAEMIWSYVVAIKEACPNLNSISSSIPRDEAEVIISFINSLEMLPGLVSLKVGVALSNIHRQSMASRILR